MRCINFRPLHSKLFQEQKYCDVTFVFKDSKGTSTSIGAHKLILALVSDVFDAKFYGESVGSGLVSETNEFEIQGVGAKSFELFLRYAFNDFRS